MSGPPLTPEAFQSVTGVSRETVERLRAYEALLRKWQTSINLVGAATLADIWRRHFLDSVQLVPFAPAGVASWLDVGSGAGLPGLVVAIVSGLPVHLVESDARKAAFLREASRVTEAKATVHPIRVEAVSRETVGGPVGVFSARAVAPPNDLLEWTQDLRAPHSIYLLLVGRDYGGPLTEARKRWKMEVDEFPSQSDPSSRVLRIQGVPRGGSSSSAD
jgi:16S rRNA (guanine527-N7)-methyltransferase